jgi:hypothetical protein
MTLKQFYFICLIGTTFLGGCMLLLFNKRLKTKQNEKNAIYYIALAMFSWSTIGLYKVFDPPIPKLLITDIDRIFSAFTNIFFVAALPFFPNVFDHLKKKIRFFNQSEKWIINVFVFFAFLTALFTVLDKNITSEIGKKTIIGIDSIFSTLTIGLVSYALYKAITNVWVDKILKLVLITFLALFTLTQLIIPLTAIAPSSFGFLYIPMLMCLLIGIIFFNFATFAFWSTLIDLGTNDNLKEEQTLKKRNLQINRLNLGYDSKSKMYFIEFEIEEDANVVVERIENTKILLPFSNWILFAIAKKYNVKITNQDISLTKFRMVEYWNKDANFKLSQEILFTNDYGKFELSFNSDFINFEGLEHLSSKLIITEILDKNLDHFIKHTNIKNSSELFNIH